jgi:hypothetical protein
MKADKWPRRVRLMHKQRRQIRATHLWSCDAKVKLQTVAAEETADESHLCHDRQQRLYVSICYHQHLLEAIIVGAWQALLQVLVCLGHGLPGSICVVTLTWR